MDWNNPQDVKQYYKQYYLKNKEKHNRRSKLDYEKNKENRSKQNSIYRLEKTYKLTVREYNKILDQQNGVCAICGKTKNELKTKGNFVFRPFNIDHNHRTGKIRGLLCQPCNAAIGLLRADEGIELLQKAINYIKEYEKV